MKGYSIGNNAAVTKMASLHITGNVIALEWFKCIKLESGKPDSIAILLLADIVYWYRPIEVRDEGTGLVTGHRKKFAADKLQRSYEAFATAYGYTKDQVKDALKRLEESKVIDIDFRHPTINGVKYGNLLFIGLNVDRLAEITTPLSPLNPIGYEDKSLDPLTFKDDTNTEITTETTTETTQKGSGLSEKDKSDANAMVTAIIENQKKVKYQNRDKLPEPYLIFADLYNELTKQEPTKRAIREWMMTFEDWKQEGLQPDHIRAAWQYANRPEGGFPVGRPSALTNTAVAMKSKALARPQSSQPSDESKFDRQFGSLIRMLDQQEKK